LGAFKSVFISLACLAVLSIFAGASAFAKSIDPALGPVVFSLAWLATFVLAAPYSFSSKRGVLLLVSWTLVFTLSNIVSGASAEAVFLSFSHVGCMAVGVALAHVLPSSSLFPKIMRIGWIFIVFSLIGYLIDLPTFRFSDGLQRTNWLGLEPLSGFFSHKINASQVALIVAICLVVLRPRFWGVMLIVFLFVMSLTNAYGGIVFGTAAVIFTAVFVKLWRKSTAVALIYFVIFFVLGLLLLPQIISLMEAFTGRDVTKLTGRTHIWAALGDVISQRPILGFGYGMTVDNDYFVDALRKRNGGHYLPPHLHNTFLQFLGDIGVIGLILFTVTLVWVFLRMLVQYQPTADRELQIGLVLVVFFTLNGVTEFTFSYNSFATVLLGYFFVRVYHEPVVKLSQTNLGAKIR
jgi:O-antigen ligase